MSSLVRLYNDKWQCQETPMSAFERHVSCIVEEESAGQVEEKFTSSNSQYTALKMLRHLPHLRYELLILEGTGDSSNGMTIHRRLGVLTVEHRAETSSPSITTLVEELDKSLRSQLSGGICYQTTKLQSIEVFEEIDAWPTHTIIIE
jgi:hypothetical protein